MFAFGATEFTDYSLNATLNDSGLSADEVDSGGFFTIGVSVGRFFQWVLFGVGLPLDTPLWFMLMFGTWQTLFTIFTVGFIISSIWNG